MAQGVVKLETALTDIEAICFDTTPLIYYFEKEEPYHSLTVEIFDAVANERLIGFLSMISVTEFVVKPFSDGKVADVSTFKQFVSPLPIHVVPPTYDIAEKAGQLRAAYRLKTPDALIAATALATGCDALITNDKDLRKLEPEGITVIVLSDFIT